jgi:hypothetical protein
MREIELEEEEELNQREKDLKKREKILRMPKCKKKCNIILLHAIGSTLLYVVILISIYYNSNLYYILYFQFLCSSTVRLLVHPWVQRVLRIFAKRKGIFHFSLETTTHHFQVSDAQQDRAVPRESRVVAANVEQASVSSNLAFVALLPYVFDTSSHHLCLDTFCTWLKIYVAYCILFWNVDTMWPFYFVFPLKYFKNYC